MSFLRRIYTSLTTMSFAMAVVMTTGALILAWLLCTLLGFLLAAVVFLTPVVLGVMLLVGLLRAIAWLTGPRRCADCGCRRSNCSDTCTGPCCATRCRDAACRAAGSCQHTGNCLACCGGRTTSGAAGCCRGKHPDRCGTTGCC